MKLNWVLVVKECSDLKEWIVKRTMLGKAMQIGLFNYQFRITDSLWITIMRETEGGVKDCRIFNQGFYNIFLIWTFILWAIS